MINLIKKDMRINFSNKVTNIMLIMYFPFILLALGNENISILFMFSTVSFVFIMTKINFVYETRDKSHIFTQSLPVRKRDIVISKYISIFINFILGVIYTFIYMWVAKLVGIINFDKIQLSTILSSLGLSVVALSISMPMQFRFSSKLADFFNMLFYIVIISLIMRSEDIFLRILKFDMKNIYNILLIIGGIIAVYLISIATSIGLYKTRKFY